MNCEETGERILDHVDGQLTADEDAGVREHLEICGSCRAEAEAARETWSMLGSLEEPRPSEAMRERFFEMLAEHRGRETRPARGSGAGAWIERFWPARPAVQAAIALGMLVLGVWLGGRALQAPGSSDEIRQLRAEMESMNRAVVLSLLENRSASERLRAVSLTQNTPGDSRVTDALLQVIATDPSVNVRLAALEVLSQMAKRPEVHQKLLDAFPRQTSPTMTAAMADVLMAVDGPRSRQAIENAVKKKELPDDVRKYLENTLLEEH